MSSDPSHKYMEKRDNDSSSKEVGILDYSEVVYLIFDKFELLHEWNNGFNLILALFKLFDLTRIPNLGLIFIINVVVDSFYSHTGALEPLIAYESILMTSCIKSLSKGILILSCIPHFSSKYLWLTFFTI